MWNWIDRWLSHGILKYETWFLFVLRIVKPTDPIPICASIIQKLCFHLAKRAIDDDEATTNTHCLRPRCSPWIGAWISSDDRLQKYGKVNIVNLHVWLVLHNGSSCTTFEDTLMPFCGGCERRHCRSQPLVVVVVASRLGFVSPAFYVILACIYLVFIWDCTLFLSF